MSEKYQGAVGFYAPDVIPVGNLFSPVILCLRQIDPHTRPDIYFILMKMGVHLPDIESAKIVADTDFAESRIEAEKQATSPIERAKIQTEEFKKRGYYPIRDFNRLLDELEEKNGNLIDNA